MLDPKEIRSWEPASDMPGHCKQPGGTWILCCSFGERGKARVYLAPCTSGWELYISGERMEHDVALAEVEGIEERDVVKAMCWALRELASISRDRAEQATGQCYQLMSELVKIREDSARQRPPLPKQGGR